ncbi:MAG TPA: T9SS type A sorting domain-containing protein [Flavobacteriales bacterium]|nr:T9SS type A sorting domain-containing protein [Flavobacteriales bacterium]
MKKTLTIVFCLFVCSLAQAQQGSITSLSISPTNPTISDTIFVYCDMQFGYSSCDLDNSAYTIVGNTIPASSHHCLGMLTAVCNITDTFKINPLSSGVYNFILTLTSGFGGAPGPPCTPGIVPDDYDTVQFEVIDPTIIETINISKLDFTFYPNPNEGLLHYNISQDLFLSNINEMVIFSSNGQEVLSNLIRDQKGTIPLDLESGIYFVRMRMNNMELTSMKKLFLIR